MTYLFREIRLDDGKHVVNCDWFEGASWIKLGLLVFLVDLRVCTCLLKGSDEVGERIQNGSGTGPKEQEERFYIVA